MLKIGSTFITLDIYSQMFYVMQRQGTGFLNNSIWKQNLTKGKDLGDTNLTQSQNVFVKLRLSPSITISIKN